MSLVEHATDGHRGAILQAHLREERQRAPGEVPRLPADCLDDGLFGLNTGLAAEKRPLEKFLRNRHLGGTAGVGHHHQLPLAGRTGLLPAGEQRRLAALRVVLARVARSRRQPRALLPVE